MVSSSYIFTGHLVPFKNVWELFEINKGSKYKDCNTVYDIIIVPFLYDE